jgi:hypothetical protein
MSSNAPMLTPALSISIISSTLNPACAPAQESSSMAVERRGDGFRPRREGALEYDTL